jgi:hypothetical protein
VFARTLSNPLAPFVQTLHALMGRIARARPSRNMSENLRTLVIWHLHYFLRRLARAALPSPLSKPRTRTPHTPTQGMMMRATAWLPLLAPFWLADIAPDIQAARATLMSLMENENIDGLLAENPKIGRTLRPLCRMFGIKPPSCLRLPRPIPKPKSPSLPRPRGFTLIGFHPILPHLADPKAPKKPA